MNQILSLITLLLISGCAYTYKESTTSARITHDTFRVSVKGNEYNEYDEVHDFMLLKAAETAKEQGHSHFYFINVDDTTKTSVYSTPGTVSTTNVGGYTSMTYTPGYVGTSSEPGTSGMIKVFTPEEGAELPSGVFRADEIIQNIKPRIDKKGN